MKSWMFAAAALALVAACAPPAQQQPAEEPAQQVSINVPSGEYALDPTHTSVTIGVKHFGLSTYRLRFNTVSGTLAFNADDPAQSSVQAEVAVNSLDTPYAGDRDFDAELQNSEWLDATTHPVATFRSTAVEVTGANTARVTGDLTIRGVTRPITLNATYNVSHAQHPMGFPIALIGFSAEGTFNRSEFGVATLLPSAPGGTDGVSDEVQLAIEAEFTRPVEQAAPAAAPAAPAN